MDPHHSLVSASPSEGAVESPLGAKHHSPSHQQRHRSTKTHSQIKIEPNCLVFPPPHFGRCIQNAISIYNVSKQPCVFKMRSQNPERYVAKPHVAIMAPESATRSFVTLRDMNTMRVKNLPEGTQDRFRFSVKLYDPDTVDPSLSPKDLWRVLAARGQRADHEQDLIAYFTKRDTPVGGLITFFPPTYIPVIPLAASETASPSTPATAAIGAQGSHSAATLTSNGDASTEAQRRKIGGGAAPKSAAFLNAAKDAAASRGFWIIVSIVAVMVLSVAVMARRTWGVGGTAAVQVEAAAAPGRPAPELLAKQAHRVVRTVSVEPPPPHKRLVQQDGEPGAEPVPMQRHSQHRKGRQSSETEVAPPAIESPRQHYDAPPAREEGHHHRHQERCQGPEARVETAVAEAAHQARAEHAPRQQQEAHQHTEQAVPPAFPA
ncbi:hypothetical protein CUR178_06101 [Leishmania enriettii]|uniref:MSP domain-containing protein n=1 Tax=Leishmania enriettii TaxID=5663 RepID=A0A836KPP8_LEIEN|nr:hypothetical protein CUR178_06101 [Leishmania enriettii]